jgi:LPS O-antigen subunit length determinant protein (WzzB/FepE family)
MTELTPQEIAELRVSLRDHFEARIKALEKATDIASNNLKERLSTMNVFREQLKEQASHFITRTEHDVLCTRIGSIENSIAKMEGKASQSAVNIGYAISALVLIVSIILHFVG